MDSKTDLRFRAKELRKTLPIQDTSEKLVHKIKSDKVFINAKNVMIFYPTKYEINLLGLLNEGKNFYLPRVNGQELEVCPYKSGDELIKSEFCIYEPTCKAVNPKVLDLVIVPALMADRSGNRLGYGCGYYDRFLNSALCCSAEGTAADMANPSRAAAREGFKTICAISKEFFIEKLPTEGFDMPVDKVFTD